MKSRPILSRTAKSAFAFFVITLLFLANINPGHVYATCIPGGGGTVTCDGADDTVSGADVTTDGGTATNTISGDGGNDVITGGDAGAVVGGDILGNNSVVINTLSGGDGNDVISGGNTFGHSADETNNLDGGAGDDTITGGSSWGGNSTADNLIIGGEGNDTIFPGGDRGTVNIIDGGNGTDTIDYSYFGAGITIDLGVTDPQKTTPQLGNNGESTDTLSNIENITGTIHDDTLTGTAGDNVIIGNAGDDVLAGDGGKDTISGGEGSDTIVLSGELGTNNGPGQHDAGDAAEVDGGSGANTIQFAADTWGNIFLVSSSGLDTLDFTAYNAPITIDISNSAPQLVATVPSGGGAGEAAVAATSNQLWVTLSGLFQNVFGSMNFVNTITGNSLDNSLTGGNQDDFLNGGGGSNELHGLGGEDTDSAATPVPGGVINQSGTWDSIEKPAPLPVETEEPPVETEEPPVETEEPPVETEEPPIITETPIPPSGEDTVIDGGIGGGQSLIPVTGGLLKLGCGSNTFSLPNGDKVTISGLCGDYWVSLESLGSNLPGTLPDGKTMLSGLTVQIYQGKSEFDLTLMEPLPQGAKIDYSFLLQANNTGLSSYLWKLTGSWFPLEGGQVAGGYFNVTSNQNGTVVLLK